MMYGYGTDVGFGFGGWLGILGLIALVVGVIVLIVWLVGRTGQMSRAQMPPATQGQVPPAQPAGQDALELLRMRFARGEITEQEFRAARQVLEEGR